MTQPGTAARTVPSQPVEEIAGADVLRDAVSNRSATIADVINQLDAWGFTVGDTRFSVWSLLVVIAVVVGVLLLARIGSRLSHKLLGRITRLDSSQRLLGEKLLTIAVWALAIMVGIDLLGVDLTALAVFSGAMGLAVGFGLQKTFGNLIAGIILLMDRSIKPGDVIAIADQAGNETFGQFRKIGIRAVSITTRDEREYVIPNDILMINQVENWSYSSREVRVKIPVGVAYSSDMALAEKLMYEAAKDTPRILDFPPTNVLMMAYGDSSVNFEIRIWITDPEAGIANVRSEVLKRLWNLFKENGIEIPFPQRDLNLRESEAFRDLVEALRQERGEAGPS